LEAAVFSALGEPGRLRIVELLRRRPHAVGEIVERLGMRQPQVSKHLKVLAQAGLVRVQPRARHRIYHLEATAFEEMRDWVDSFEELWETRLDSLGRYLVEQEEEEKEP
jgi:DNA-binding transcriptional ArsR family regulator